MNTHEFVEFQEAAFLADYVIRTALIKMTALDSGSKKALINHAKPDDEADIVLLLQRIEDAEILLKEAMEAAKRVIVNNMEDVQYEM